MKCAVMIWRLCSNPGQAELGVCSTSAISRARTKNIFILLSLYNGFNMTLQLHKLGYKNIDGVDPCEKMLHYAREKQVYRELTVAAAGDEPMPLKDGKNVFFRAIYIYTERHSCSIILVVVTAHMSHN